MTMKRNLKMAVIACILVLGSSLRNTASAQYDQYDSDREVSYQTFYDELSPYGRWVDNPDYGYVWVPDAGDDFRPYSSKGHWVWTENYEWMWVSDYDWGWAPFHYGRWEEDSYYGWFWVPGYEWSSAWVAWRDGGDYYGWAPIRPGINISINFNIGGYSPPDNYWCFAPRQYITSPRIFDYCVDRRRNVTIIHQTIIINNNYNYGGSYGFRCGPRRYDAERYCGRINPVRFRESYNPGRTSYRNNEVNVYRPNVRRDDNRTNSPRQFERFDRSNGQFRNGRSDDGFRRNNDGRRDNASNNGGGINRPDDRRGRNDNAPFRRTEDDRRSNDGNNGGNINRPGDRRERTDNPPFRRPEDIRQPANNGGDNNIYRRRMERTDNNQPPQPERRMSRPEDRREPNGPGAADSRRFERRNGNGGNTNVPNRESIRQPGERTDNNGNRPQRQPAQQPMERRQESRPQPQQQPRQFERRSDDGGNRQPAGNSDNRGNGGGGRGRRF
jgi:hypothetical protein